MSIPRRDRRQRGRYSVRGAIPLDLLVRIRQEGILYVEREPIYTLSSSLAEESEKFLAEFFRGYRRLW